jgi:guanylate kinase
MLYSMICCGPVNASEKYIYWKIFFQLLSAALPRTIKGAMTFAPALQPIVISGPSGCGKSTLLNRLFKEHPEKFGFSVSHTTRKPRLGELQGREYNFVTRDAFEEMIHKGEFIEHAQFTGNLYGTSINAVQSVLDSGKTCILDLELNGVKSMHLLSTQFNPRFIFVQPPSIEELRKRLTLRQTETPESLEGRLRTAEEAMAYASEQGSYDAIIINDDLEKAYGEFAQFILS